MAGKKSFCCRVKAAAVFRSNESMPFVWKYDVIDLLTHIAHGGDHLIALLFFDARVVCALSD
jgi:hypothetical protein